jgi:hypothetical protein
MSTIEPTDASVPPAQPAVEEGKQDRRREIFGGIVLAVVLVALALVVRPDTEAFTDDVDSALALAELNEGTASGAPQQTVVNGWVARDLLEVHSKQTNTMLDLQFATVVALIVVAAAIVWSTLRRSPSPT